MIYDRIAALCVRMKVSMPSTLALQYDKIGQKYVSDTPVHDFLDTLDRRCGILTRFRPPSRELTPVGERVRRLERHLDRQITPPYFHLGAMAEELALTG